MKPDIVFFGEVLPMRFFELAFEDFKVCDLLILIGTSLQVQPFAGLIDKVRHNVPRLLINREEVGVVDPPNSCKGFSFDGEVGKYRRDALYLGACDDGALELAKLCGMEADLRDLYDLEHLRLDVAMNASEKTAADASDRDIKTVMDDVMTAKLLEQCATVDLAVTAAASTLSPKVIIERVAMPGE